MTTIRPTLETPHAKAPARGLDAAAHWLFTAPERADAFARAHTASPPTGPWDRWLRRPAIQARAWLQKTFLNYDYDQHLNVTIAGRRMQIAQPPIGACAAMLLLFTTLPRLTKALSRAENNDYSEFWDVLRRDTLTLTTILFALDPLRLAAARRMQPHGGIRLVNDENTLMDREATRLAYTVKAPRTLATFLRTPGNTPQALQKAFGDMAAQWRAQAHDQPAVRHALESLLQDIAAMGVAQAQGAEGTQALDTLSEKAFDTIQTLDSGWRAEQLQTLSGKAREAFSQRVPLLRSALARFADVRRLPVSVGSFALVCLGIGWLPVEFNRQWNKRRYAQASARPSWASVPPLPSAPGGGALHRSPFLGQAFVSPATR